MGFNFGFGSGSGKSTTSSSTSTIVTAMDAASKAQLDELTSLLLGKVGAGSTGFSKADAVSDVAGTVRNIFDTFRNEALPKIFDAGGSAGVFNSTSLQRMADQAYGKAVGEAAAVTMDAVKSYAGIAQQEEQLQLQGLLDAFGLQADAYKTEASTGTSSTRSKGRSFGLSGALK